MIGTVPDALREQAQKRPRAVALRWKRRGIWHERTWAQYLREVERLAWGLLQRGLAPGKVVLIQGGNSVERLQAEQAALLAGDVAACADTPCVEADLATLCAAQRPTALLADTATQIGMLRRLSAAADAPAWLLRGPGGDLPAIADLAAPPDAAGDWPRLGRDDAALVLPTTGSDAAPRAVTIAHGTLIAAAERLRAAAQIGERDLLYSLLPTGWIGDRAPATALHPLAGGVLGFPEDVATARADLQECGPSVLLAPSRLWQLIALDLWARVGRRGWRARLVRSALAEDGSALARALVARPLRDHAGLLRLRLALSAGDALDRRTAAFFRAIGVNIRDLYLVTEAGGGVALADGAGALHWLDGLTGTLEDGELLLGLDDGSMLATGDCAELYDRQLTLGGRCSAVATLAGGEVVNTATIARALCESPFLRHALVFAENRPRVTALLDIEEAAVATWAEARQAGLGGRAEFVRSQAVRELIAGEVARANAALTPAAAVHDFLLAETPFDAAAGELTRLRTLRAPIARERRAAAAAALDGEERVWSRERGEGLVRSAV